MATYELAGIRFLNKEAVATYAKAIKDHHRVGDVLKDDELAFMYALLCWHPDAADKIGVGVKTILVRANPSFGHNEFYLLRVDGSATEFSYKQCVHPSTPEADFKTACRVAVTADIIQFQREFFVQHPINPLCPFTGERLTKDNAHVDHAPPTTFQNLLRDFVVSSRLKPAQVPLLGRNLDNSFRVRLADEVLEQRWITHHRTHARLRVISQQANLSMVGKDWDNILEYLCLKNHSDVLVEWKGKQRYFTHIEGIDRGILLASDKAPDGVTQLDGTIAVLEMSTLQDQTS